MKQEDQHYLQDNRQNASRIEPLKTESYSTLSSENTPSSDYVEIMHTQAQRNSSKRNFIKHGLGYGLSVLITMALGLASRRYADMLPPLLDAHAGDMLWAMMVYWGVRLILYRHYSVAVIAALLFCYGIEFSQLYQADWIRQLRDTTIGGLVLGHGFLIVDLIRYTVGIVLATALDMLARYMLRQIIN